jgi:hypothetical protein
MNRTEELLKLRPKIKTIKDQLDSVDTEMFQNQTIRPILKLQHDLLLAMFHACMAKNKVTLENLEVKEIESKITYLIQKDLAYKNQSIGAVLGQFTNEEYAAYIGDNAVYNRRIISMLKQRILSTYT